MTKSNFKRSTIVKKSYFVFKLLHLCKQFSKIVSDYVRQNLINKP